MNILRTLRRFRVGSSVIMMVATISWSTLGYAETLYRSNSGAAGSFLDSVNTTPAAPGPIIQNYAEGVAPTSADIIAFNNLITAASNFRVSAAAATNLSIAGLQIGTLFNGVILNPAGAITLQNGASLGAQTLTLGAGGIDMSLAAQNLTISSDTTGGASLTTVLGVPQTWSVNTGRTLTVSTNINTGGNALTIQAGLAGAGTVVLGGTSGSISGGGALIINGQNTGAGNVVTLSGNNGAAGLGATTVAGGSQLNIDQAAAGQNKLNDTASLTLNRATLNFQGTGAGTETVGSVVLGAGQNVITRTAGTGVLASTGLITRSTGAVLNVGTASIVSASNGNTNGILGGWAVINQSDFATNAFAAVAATTTAEASWTAALNEVQTANVILTGAREVNSLKFNGAGAQTLTLTGQSLNVTSGGILRNQNFGTTLVGGTITAGGLADTVADELFLWNNQSTMAVNSAIIDNFDGVATTDVVNVTKAGAGSVTLTGVNTYTGVTTVAAGTLNLGDNLVGGNAATFGTGAIVNHGLIQMNKTAAATLAQRTIFNDISGSGALTNLRASTTVLSGNNTYYGNTTVTLGTLQADSTGGFSPNSRMILNAAGVGAVNNSAGGVSVSGLSGAQNTAFFTLGAFDLTLSGLDPTSNGAAQSYQGIISGAGGLVKNGIYTQNLTGTGALSYTGTTTVNGGILQTNKAMSTSALTVNNSGSTFISNVANSLTPTTAVTLASAGAIWQINNGLNQSVGPLSGVAGSVVNLQDGAGSIVLTVTDNGGVPTIFNGVINSVAGAGAGSVIKEGTNTWVLGGGNSFGGGLTVNGGIVQMAAANPVGVLGDFVPVVLADVAGVALDVNGNNASIGSLAGGGTTGGNVTLGAAGRLTTGINNTSTTFGGAITGGTAGVETLIKVGNGTMTLAGTNTFLGDVVIRRGTGGLTLSGGSALDDTVNIRNFGNGSTLTVLTSETVGAVTGAPGTKIVLGPGATLTASYTDGTPTVLAATADTNSTAGRIVKGIDTSGLVVGSLISGTSIPVGSYIVQILDGDSVLINAVPTPTTTDFAPTITTTARLASDISGTGGFTKNGTGLLFMAGNSTYSGDTTINDGTIQVGGIWTGRDFSIQDQLSDNSQFVFAGTGTQNLNFANSATNLTQFERIGSLAGGSVTSTINLLTGSSVAALAIGGDDKSSTYNGRILGESTATWLLKEGTGTFTWANPTGTAAQIFNGTIVVDGGGFTTTGAFGLDTPNSLLLQNNGTTYTSSVTANDTIALLQGGGKGASRVLANGIVGGLQANYIGGADATIVMTTAAIRLTTSSGTSSVFGGVITGAGDFTKEGTGTLELRGANTYTGQTLQNGGTLRMGIYGGAAGVGVVGTGGNGTLGAASSIRSVTGTLDINGTNQTVTRFAPSSTGGIIQLVNGSLTLSDQNSQTVGTVFTGNLGSVLNINSTVAAQTLSLNGNSTGFGGSINVGINSALTLNRAGGALNSTGIPAANINLNGTGTQLTVTLADTIGTLTGTGNAVLTQALTLREAGSGAVSATAFSGATSGAGALILSSFGGLTVSGNLAHSGGTTLSGGSSLILNYGAGNNILPGTGALTLNGGSVRISSSVAVPTILESAASTSLNAGASSIQSPNSGQGGINLNTITRAAGGMLNVGSNAAAASNANVNGILGGWATFDENTWAVGDGAGLVAITGLGAFSANTFGAGLHVDITAAGPNAGGLADTLRFSGANAADITGATTITTGGILNRLSVGANTSTISGALDATDNELKIHQYNTLGDLLLSNIAGTNTIVTTAGGGKTLISNSIAGTGTTNIGYGYLQLGDVTVGGSAAGMVGSGLILNDGTLGVNRSNAETFAAIISGTGNIEQLGSGTTTLSAANTYQGRTTVRNGTLEVTNNAGLGAAATAPTNRWANLTSVNTGGTLLLNVAAGGALTEILNLDGGTLDLRSTIATTLGAPIVLTSDSTIHVSNTGAAVSHIISGEIFALPGADLTITNVGGATPSTLVLAPAATTGARWENTTINANGRLQIGNNTRGFLGTGDVTNNGELILNINDGHYVVGNTISGSGNFTTVRNTVYLTADNTYTGTTTIGSTAQNAVLRVGNDTYSGSTGTGAITVQSSTAGNSQIRYHLIEDYTVANAVTLIPNADGTTARNADFVKEGLGTMTFTGTMTGGAHVTAPGTQRSLITANSKMVFAGTLVSAAGSEVNLNANAPFVFAGSVSNNWNGVIGGAGPFIFRNSGTTTLSGANTFNTATYLDLGTVSLTGGAASQDDNDWYVQNGATLNIAASETVGAIYSQKGATVSVPTAGQTLTIDDNVAGLMNATLTGAGNLTLAGGNYLAIQGTTNTISGTLTLNNGTIRSDNLTNAIGSFATVNLGSGANAGNLEYVGTGETFAENLNLSGTTGGARITASGTGALILSGNITNTGVGNKTLFLTGQTGGGITSTAIINRVDGIISEGANVLTLSMPANANDDRFGVTSRWALTNASNDFSGNIIVNTGNIELNGDLKTGVETTSVMGDLTATRTIDLGTNNYDGRRYDAFGSGDQLGAVAAGTFTSTLIPNGSTGTIIFNDPNAGTATFGSNITFTQSFSSTTNPGAGQIRNIGAKQIIINGNLTSGASGNRNWVLDGTNTLTNTIGGIISNGTGNVVGVIKEGAGTWRLSGANTFTGAVTIARGVLEVSGGSAVGDGAAVSVTAAGSDGLATGPAATFRVVGSESIGTLTGNIGSFAAIDAAQTLTILGGSSTMNGIISGDGNLSRIVTGATAGTLSAAARNTYGGVTTIGSTGAATASAGITIWHLANGGVASGIGASTNAASNLVFTSNTAANQGGVLTWAGFTNQSTDRLFTMGLGTNAARINASGTLVTTTTPTMQWLNTGAIAFTGAGTRTLILGGTTISNNEFRPQITDGGGATSLSKQDAGMWLINPDVAGNTYTGTTTIAAGTLAIQAGNALGSGTINITGGGGGTGLEIRGGITLGNAITNSAADGALRASSGTNVLTGIVTATTAAQNLRVAVNAGASLELSNALAGAGNLLTYGNGTVILSGLNTFTGTTTVRDGILRLEYGTNNTSKLADGVALTLGGIGALTSVGSDGSVPGQTNVFGQGGGTINLSGGSHVEVVSATTVDTGSNAVTRAGGSTAVLRMNAITRNVNQGTIDFGASGIADTDTTNTAGILGTTTTGAFATVAKTDWAFNSTNGADGAINALAAYATDAYGAGNNTDITLAAATTGAATQNNTFRFNANQATTLTLGAAFGVQGTAVGLQAGGILVTPTVGLFTTTIDGAPLQNAANTVNFATIVHQHNTLGALEINSVIQNNALATAQGLTKTGAGKLFLGANNTYTGVLNLYEGEIQVGGTAAAPTVATSAYLSGFGATGNNSSAWNLGRGTTLRFLTTNTAVYNTPAIVGDGAIILDTGNLGVLLLDDNQDNFLGTITFNGGTIQVANQNQALGNIRGLMTVNNSVNFVFNTAITSNKLITYNEGTVFNVTSLVGGTFNNRQTFANTTTAGLEFNIGAPTVATTVGLNISGIVYGSNGFTKTGAGILQISGVNFTDVEPGFTVPNNTASLFGQIRVNGGILYVGGVRALGAFGVGNETIAASGATVDLRDQDLNLGDESNPSREIFQISGAGVNSTGALRNTAGTAQFSHLVLNADSTISGGGFANGSRLDLSTFDTNLNNGSALLGNFTRNSPTIDGNGNDLTIVGNTFGGNVVLHTPTFNSALGSITISEGNLRIEQDVPPLTAWTGISATDVPGGITLAYGGATLADLTNPVLGVGPNVGSRLNFYRNDNIHHTVNITMDGVTALANSGRNYIDIGTDTIVARATFLDGTITLLGDSKRNIIQTEAGGNFSVQEQGNLTVGLRSKLIVGGQIVGTGGFTKTGFSELRLTNDNTFTGDLNVLRFGFSAAPWQSNTVQINGVDYTTFGEAEGWGEWGVTLNGTGAGDTGKISGVANINLQRRGMITLDNTTRLDATSGVTGGNDNNRINDSVVTNFDNGWLRINGGTVNNTEAIGVVNVQSGTNILDLYPTDGAGTNMTLTIAQINRSAGASMRITNLDSTSTFSTAAAGESVRVALTSPVGLTQVGGGGAAGTTNRDIVIGVLGGTIPYDLLTDDLRLLGFNNGNVTDLYNQQRNLQFLAGSHMMTYDGGFLRPLDDSEYFVSTDSLINPTSGAGQNVSINGVNTIMNLSTSINSLRFGPLMDHNGSGGAINSSTTLTSQTDHHSVAFYVDGTLGIASGMVSSAYFSLGNSSGLSTIIQGGSLDFGAREAVINNQNGTLATPTGTISTGNFEIKSAILGTGGLLKTGLARVVLDGHNTYSGVTSISDGELYIRNGRAALGAGGAGNGVVITGNGSLFSGSGIQVGTAAAREDIYVGVLNGDNQIVRTENDVTNWFSNITVDNVDLAGQASFTPRIRTDNSATSILNGNIFGGNTVITNNTIATDSRRLSFNSAGNNVFIIRGQIGDKDNGSGIAIPIADPISTLPTLAGVRTNENEVLRVDLGGGTFETNFILDRQYNAVGRLTLEQGNLIINYDPTAVGNDGTGFWTDAALSRIPNADSTTTSFAINGGTALQGFQLGSTSATGFNNGATALLMVRDGQAFNMASFSTVGSGAKYIGGLNESGTVTYGNGTGTLTIGGALVNFQAMDGGTVVIDMRLAGAIGIAPNNFNFLKQGRGTVELQNSTAGATSADSNFVLAGGTLRLSHSGVASVALVGLQNARFDGGTLISVASSDVNTTENIATDNANSRFLNFSIGGTEIVARTSGGRNMLINMGNGNAGGTTATSNLLRGLGATANLVEDSAAGGTAQITLNFNATTTAAVKNQIIPWATYGTLSRTATDFAMSDAGAANDVRAFGRALDEFNNNVATWGAGQDVSENGGGGFSGALAGPLTLSTIRFDANADSVVDLGTNVLTVSGPGSNSFGGAILVSTIVGSANKTITGGVGAELTTSGAPNELIIHHYGTGNLNINVPITGANNLVITGPSTTNAATIGTTGAVVLGAANTYTGRTFINGAVLSVNDTAQLGINPAASTANQITLNGGTLRYSGRGFDDMQNRGLTFDGNGGTIDVVEASGALRTDNITSNGLYRGDLIKVGAGSLILEGINAASAGFQGLIDVREGTLRLNGDFPTTTSTTAITATLLGTSNSYADGTIFRTGTNFAIQMGNRNDVSEWNIDEWLTFEGNNYVTVGTINTVTGVTPTGFPNPNNERPINLNGVITINGNTIFDVVPGQTLRLNNGGTGYTTGNGDIIKDGQGAMQFQANSPDFTGGITILQGRIYGQGQADPLGTGYLTGKIITLGSDSRQGIAELSINSDAISGGTTELNHAVNVVYNPSQTKRIYFETFGNGSQIEANGNITLNDNLNIYINDGAEVGGSQNYVNINGQFKDGTTTSGNIVFSSDDAGGANDNTNGRPYNYLVLKADNSLWTGDIRVSTNTSYDQDQTAILRLEHNSALTAANDVDMGFNSMLQTGGGARTIGSLSTNGGVGPFIGGMAGGTMGASTNGTTVVIENAATTAGTLTITQSTPATTEVQWNAHFRDGTLNSEFFAPGSGPTASAALNLVKAGDGWATLTTVNAYTGTTTVTGGILQVGRGGVGDTGAITAAGFSSAAGTTVAGTGIIQGAASIAGDLKPGDEAGGVMGTLTVNGTLTLASTANIVLQAQRASYTAVNQVGYDHAAYGGWLTTIATDPTYSHLLNDPVTNAQHDKVLVTGGIISGGNIVLANNGYNPTAGDIFNLFDWVGAALGFNVGGTAYNGGLLRTGAESGTDLDLFELGGDFRWDVSQFNSSGFVVVVIPEPSRMVLLFFGLVALFFRRRRGI